MVLSVLECHTGRDPGGQPGGFHTSALADTPPALWISGWARLWVCSWGRSQSHSGFGQDESLYLCSGLHLCFWGHQNFLKLTWAVEAWDRSQHAFSEQDVGAQHGLLLENQWDTEAVQAMALFKGLMERAVFSHQPGLVRKHEQETPFTHSFRLEHYVFKLPIVNFHFSWNGDLLTKYWLVIACSGSVTLASLRKRDPKGVMHIQVHFHLRCVRGDSWEDAYLVDCSQQRKGRWAAGDQRLKEGGMRVHWTSTLTS